MALRQRAGDIGMLPGHLARLALDRVAQDYRRDALPARPGGGGFQRHLRRGHELVGRPREVAREHADIARALAQGHFRVDGAAPALPAVLLSGGETTVTVKGKGRGGRNAEFLLALALALNGAPGIHAIACDTDGVDGSEDNAGAIYGPDTIARAAARAVDLRALLAVNDSWGAFDALGDLVVTGPTLTNVNDFRAILVLQQGRI